MTFYLNVFYFSFFHWLLFGEQGSMNIFFSFGWTRKLILRLDDLLHECILFYFSFFHWLLHGEQGSMNMSTVLNKQGGRALWCYSVQRSYASKREVRADHPDVPATWLSLTWWSCWNIGLEGWISFSQAVCFTIMKNGTSFFMTSALDALVFVQVCGIFPD